MLNFLHGHAKEVRYALAAVFGVISASVFAWLFLVGSDFDRFQSIAFPIYTLINIGILIVYSHIIKKQILNVTYVLLGLSMVFSVFVSIRASIFLTFFNVVLTFLLLIATVDAQRNGRLFFTTFIRRLFSKIAYLLYGVQAIAEIFQYCLRYRKHSGIKNIFIGLIIAAPITVIIIHLLIVADPIFAQSFAWVNDLAKLIEKFAENIGDIIIWTMVMVMVGGALVDSQLEKKDYQLISHKSQIAFTTVSTILVALNLIFILFNFIQVKYMLLSPQSIIDQLGKTYAEYAREGFGQLIAVSIIVFLVLSLAHVAAHQKIRENKFTFGLVILTILNMAILMASAFNRIVLYEQQYGFTISRVFGQLFIVWLLYVFISLGRRIALQLDLDQYYRRILAFALVIWIGLNVVNLESRITSLNLDRGVATGKFDIEYMSELSADYLPVILKLNGGQMAQLGINPNTDKFCRSKLNWPHYSNLSIDRCEAILR